MHNDILENFQITPLDGEPHWHSEGPARAKKQQRKQAYDIGQQLNFLYDDIQAGVFGESAKSGSFATYVKAIKEQFPTS